MKAAYIERHGGPEVFVYGDLPDPVAGPGEIVADIHVSTVNAADWKVRSGEYGAPLETFPYILGRDFSGTVAELGEGVDDFAVGDPVFGVLVPGHEGTYCEKVAEKASVLALKPDSLSHAEAAALALTGITAIVSIEHTIELQPGETILIHGGAGGVASFAIQLAKHIGATVITTASPSNHDYVTALGADQVIDYRSQDFTEMLSDIDAVFDTVGGDVEQRSFQVLRPGGRAAFIASGMTAPDCPRDDVASLRPAVGRERRYLERIVELHAAGAIQIPEITTYPLREAAEAHRVSEARHLKGKLVFQVR
jgi:NADPH:quinone reductase-like Zn-dependent oxidoreductase